MTSTYSPNLAIQLPGTNDQTGQWGNTTNTNLGTLIESAISGVVTQTFADANISLPMPLGADGGTGSAANPVAARNMYIQCIGTNTAVRTLTLPSNKKLYVIYNNTTGGFALTIACSTGGGTSVSLPNGSAALLVCDGTNITAPLNFYGSLISDNLYLEGQAGADIQILPTGSGAVLQSAFQYYLNNLYIDPPYSGTPTGGLTYIRRPGAGVVIQISAAGNVIVEAPTSGRTFSVIGATGSYATAITGSATVNQSEGLYINSGTSSSDYALVIQNQTATTALFYVYGDGGVTVGAPTGTSNGVGTINVQNGIYLNNQPIYSGAPINTQNANYTLVLADANKIIYHTSGTAHTYAITDSLYSTGTLITITNLGGNVSITNTGTTYWSPSGTTGSRTLAQFGTCTYQKLAAGVWVVSGSGLT